MLDKMLNIRGTLTSLATPLVMGILNITGNNKKPDDGLGVDYSCQWNIGRCYLRSGYSFLE